MGHICTKIKVFIIYLRLKFNWEFCIFYLLNLATLMTGIIWHLERAKSADLIDVYRQHQPFLRPVNKYPTLALSLLPSPCLPSLCFFHLSTNIGCAFTVHQFLFSNGQIMVSQQPADYGRHRCRASGGWYFTNIMSLHSHKQPYEVGVDLTM